MKPENTPLESRKILFLPLTHHFQLLCSSSRAILRGRQFDSYTSPIGWHLIYHHPTTWNTALIITYRHFSLPRKCPRKGRVEFSPEAQLRIASHQPLHTAPDKIEMRLSKLSQEGLTCDAQNPATVEMKNIPNIPCLIGVSHTSIGAGFQPSTLWNKVIHIDNHYSSLVQISVLQRQSSQTSFSQKNHPKHGQSVLFRKLYVHRPVGDIPVLTLGTMGFICTDLRAKVPMSNEHQQLLDAFPLRTWGKSSFRM